RRPPRSMRDGKSWRRLRRKRRFHERRSFRQGTAVAFKSSRSMAGHLTFENLTRRFGSFTAVDRVTLEIGKGESFSLLGPSGCGKTTLLRMAAGFETPDSGRILLDGR